MEETQPTATSNCISHSAVFSEISLKRRTRRKFGLGLLAHSAVDVITVASFGVIRHFDDPQWGELTFTPIASGGALHPNVPTLVVRNVDGMLSGIYRINPNGTSWDFGSEMRDDDLAGLFANLRECSYPKWELNCPPAAAIVFHENLARNIAKYGDQMGRKLAMMDLGATFQQLSMACCAFEIAGAPLCGTERFGGILSDSVGAFVIGQTQSL